jgi:FAD/FMN-containing dehydrogenase
VSSSPSTTSISIPDFRSTVRGRVIVPADADYDEARTVFLGDIDRRPAVVVRPVDADDVATVVGLARETGLELAVRSGGHNAAGYGVSDGGIVLDLREMKAIDIDVDQRTVWAQTGLTAAELSTAVGAHGLAIGFGDTGSVGIGGITLGGGVGYLVRKFGMTVDSLLAAEIVTADGQTVRVDASSHPDLFWAIRGGGGNFGVATAFKFQLHEVPAFTGGMLMLPATPEVIASFIELAEAAPDELSTIANVMSCPPMPFVPEAHHGKLVVMGMMAYAGPADAAEKAMAPFRALATPIVDMVRPMPYPEIFPPEDASYRPLAVARTMFIDHVDLDVAKTIIRHLEASDAPMRAAQLRVLGGAMARVPAGATAFALRESKIMVNVASFYVGPEDRDRRQAWVEDIAAALRQGDDGAYVNFLADEGAERVRAAYPGTTWDRLAEIKRRYDPSNIFRLNQNIPPAAEAAS